MMDITNAVIPFGGSVLYGFFMGFTLKRILKWVLVALGVIIGAIFLVIQWMSHNGYIRGNIDWTRLGNDTTSYIQHNITQLNGLHGVFHTFGIPVTSGLAIGLVAGLIKG